MFSNAFKSFFGFFWIGCLLVAGIVIKQLDVGYPPLLRRGLLALTVFLFVGQFIVSWRKSKGFQIFVLIDLALLMIIRTEDGMLQWANLNLGIIGMTLYMYPSILLYRRNHKRKLLYLIVNFFAGVYVIPWIILLRIGLKLPKTSHSSVTGE
jgi:hypothetical protein